MHRKREEELGAPAEAELVRIRKSVFAVGTPSDPRNLHWSALAIWKRDSREVATFTENINYARVETRTRTEHFRFVSAPAAGQRQSLGSIWSKADSTLPTSRTQQTLAGFHPGKHHVFLGITTVTPSSDLPISQGWGKDQESQEGAQNGGDHRLRGAA